MGGGPTGGCQKNWNTKEHAEHKMMYFWDELGQQWTALRARNTHCKWRETLPDSVRGDVESIINVKHCTPHRALWTFIHAVAHKRSRRGVFLIAMTLYDADE